MRRRKKLTENIEISQKMELIKKVIEKRKQSSTNCLGTKQKKIQIDCD